jgi:hypothetical protein
MAKSLESIVARLADWYISKCLYGFLDGKIRLTEVITDGRSFKSLRKKLLDGGYIAPGGSSDYAVVTTKAFDELPAAPVDLAAIYEWRYDNYREWVKWDDLFAGQKKTVIQSLRADPSSYTLLLVSDWRNDLPVSFGLGGGREAGEKCGSFRAIAITDAGVRAKVLAGKRAKFHDECVRSMLTPFLRDIGAIGADEEVPVRGERTLLFLAGGASLDTDPDKLATSLPAAIARTLADIEKEQARLALLRKLEAHIQTSGGYDAFVTAYEKAITEYVEENFGKEQA